MEKVIPKHPIKPNTELSVGYSWCLENAFYLVNLMRPWCVLFTDTPIAWYQSFFFFSLEDEGISCIMSQSDISSQCHSSRCVASRQMDDKGSGLGILTVPQHPSLSAYVDANSTPNPSQEFILRKPW